MYILLFIFGAILSSFITLCAQRIPNGHLPWSPSRSYCDNCQRQLEPWQLIPILGFLLQRGRCHFCNAKIPLLFPILELASGFSYVRLITVTHPLKATIITIFIATLIFNTTTDYFYHFIYPITLLGLLPLLLLSPLYLELSNILGTVLLTLFLSIFAYRQVLGWGDIEYLFIICLLCSWQTTLIIINLASWITIIYIIITKSKRVAFIPPLALVTIIMISLKLR